MPTPHLSASLMMVIAFLLASWRSVVVNFSNFLPLRVVQKSHRSLMVCTWDGATSAMERTVLFPQPLRFFNVSMSSVLSAIFICYYFCCYSTEKVVFLYPNILEKYLLLQLFVFFMLVDVPVGVRIAVEDIVYVLVAPTFYVLSI